MMIDENNQTQDINTCLVMHIIYVRPKTHAVEVAELPLLTVSAPPSELCSRTVLMITIVQPNQLCSS